MASPNLPAHAQAMRTLITTRTQLRTLREAVKHTLTQGKLAVLLALFASDPAIHDMLAKLVGKRTGKAMKNHQIDALLAEMLGFHNSNEMEAFYARPGALMTHTYLHEGPDFREVYLYTSPADLPRPGHIDLIAQHANPFKPWSPIEILRYLGSEPESATLEEARANPSLAEGQLLYHDDVRGLLMVAPDALNDRGLYVDTAQPKSAREQIHQWTKSLLTTPYWDTLRTDNDSNMQPLGWLQEHEVDIMEVARASSAPSRWIEMATDALHATRMLALPIPSASCLTGKRGTYTYEGVVYVWDNVAAVMGVYEANTGRVIVMVAMT